MSWPLHFVLSYALPIMLKGKKYNCNATENMGDKRVIASNKTRGKLYRMLLQIDTLYH